MATSGTRTFTLTAADAIEEAYELAGLEYRTGYDGVTARRSMNIMFADFQIDRIDRGDYLDIPNKETQARVTQYYLERTITPKLYVWPAPENSTDKFISYRWKRIQDISASVDDVDVPSRFLPCLVTGLAFNLALKKNPEKAGLLQPLYEQNLVNAIKYDDDSSLRLVPRRTYI